MSGPFTLVDHAGDEVNLTTSTPAMVALLLQRAVTRALQLKVGADIAVTDSNFAGRRAAAEHVKAQLRSDRKLTAKDRAGYMAVACGAIMTYSKAAAAGYLVDDACPLCGRRGDTMVHRIWQCQHPTAVEARNAAVPRWLQDEFARAADTATNQFWTTAFIPHPADEWPAPIADTEMQYEWAGEGGPGVHDRDGDGRPLLHGSLYVDGSCTTSPFHELRRAATTVVQWAPEQPGGWRLQLPLPRYIVQSSQAAEYCAIPLIKQFTHPARAINVASDSANVVRDMTSPPKMVLTGKRMYAGLLKTALTDPEWRRRTTVRKVPAHINPTSLPSGAARDDAVGNDMADLSAKEAVRAHPSPSPAMLQDLEARIKRARYVVRALATITHCFPRMPKERMVRPPPNREGARVQIGNGHTWVFVGGLWRCEHCLRMTVRPTIDGALAHERCSGPKASMDAASITGRGHTLAQTTGLIPILFCVRCGAWSTRRAYGLSAECRRHAGPAGRQALARIAKGLQPWEEKCADTGRRRRARIGGPTGMTNCGLAAQGSRRRGQTYGDAHAAGDAATSLTELALTTNEGLSSGGPACVTIDDVVMDDAWDHGDEEDVFGFGGSLDQHDPGRQSDGDTARRGEVAQPADGDSAAVHRGKRRRIDDDGQLSCSQSTPRAAGGDGIEPCTGAAQSEDDARAPRGGHAVTTVPLHAPGDNSGARTFHAEAHQVERLCSGSDAAAGNFRRAQAKDAPIRVVGTREGPGGTRPSCSTAVAAAVPTAAVAAVAEGREMVAILQDSTISRAASANRGEATRCPPSGDVGPLESSNGVTESWHDCYSPLNTPQNLGAGPSTQGLVLRDDNGDGPPDRGTERRRDGADSPTCGEAAARDDGGAAAPRRWMQPETGWDSCHTRDACDSECATRRPAIASHAEASNQAARQAHSRRYSVSPEAANPIEPEAIAEAIPKRRRIGDDGTTAIGDVPIRPALGRHRHPDPEGLLPLRRDGHHRPPGARGLHRLDHDDDVSGDAHAAGRGSHRGAAHRHGSTSGRGAPGATVGEAIGSDQRATIHVRTNSRGAEISGNSSDTHNDQGWGVPPWAGTHSRNASRPPVPRRATPGPGRGAEAGRPQHPERAAATADRPGSVVGSEGRPIWNCPPAWLYLPHQGLGGGLDLLPAAPAGVPPVHARDDDTSYVAAPAGIRGRADPPGPRRGAEPLSCAPSAVGPGAMARHGSHPTAATDSSSRGLGPGAAASRAAQRLEARNAGIAISLAHHAERVGIKDARGRRPVEPTASERMMALRRRVSARQGAAGPSDTGAQAVGQDQVQTAPSERGHAVVPLPTSNEDAKIHPLQASSRIRMTTACRPCLAPGATRPREFGDGERAGHSDGAQGLAPPWRSGSAPPAGEVAAAVQAAAAHAAWHSNLGANGDCVAGVAPGAASSSSGSALADYSVAAPPHFVAFDAANAADVSPHGG